MRDVTRYVALQAPPALRPRSCDPAASTSPARRSAISAGAYAASWPPLSHRQTPCGTRVVPLIAARARLFLSRWTAAPWSTRKKKGPRDHLSRQSSGPFIKGWRRGKPYSTLGSGGGRLVDRHREARLYRLLRSARRFCRCHRDSRLARGISSDSQRRRRSCNLTIASSRHGGRPLVG